MRRSLLPTTACILLGLLGLIGFGWLVIYQASINDVHRQITTIGQRVDEDITYNNGRWDTHLYDADPLLPNVAPLYILTTDGFVIERLKPAQGYLDVSDFKHLLAYQAPQTITTVTGQSWRIYSLPISQNDRTLGVITVSSYNPPESLLGEIDRQLTETASMLKGKVQANGYTLQVKDLDFRTINHDIAFQVVDQFNKIVAKNNNNNSIDRLPNFIDASYVRRELEQPRQKIITDSVSHEPFLVVSRVINDEHQEPVGIIIAGKSIQSIRHLTNQYLLFMGLLALPLSLVLAWLWQRSLFRLAKDHNSTEPEQPTVRQLHFDPKGSAVVIDGQSIHIPYATNQYYLCQAIFEQPAKRWELDELLDRFGDTAETLQWRKVYDAMLHLNRRCSPTLRTKLVVVQDKTYQLNPALLAALT